MKRILLVSIMVLTIGKVFGQLNPLAHYSFNGNLADESGNGHNGSMSETPVYMPGRNGNETGSIELNGTSSFISIPFDSELQEASNLSIVAWISASSLGGIQHIFTSGENGNGDDGYGLRLNGGQIEFFALNEEGYAVGSIKSDVFINSQEWVHIVAIKNQSNQSLIVNGIKKEKESSGDISFSSNHSFSIGRRGGSTTGSNSNFFSGTIDDLQVYNRSLSDSEVEQLLGYSLRSSLEGDLVAYFPFDGAMNDGSGYNFHPVSISSNPLPVEDRESIASSAYYFDGLDDGITLPYSDILNPKEHLTISAWVYPNSISGTQTIIASGDDGGGDDGFALRLKEDKLEFYALNENGYLEGSLLSTISLLQDQWSHVVGVKNGNVLKVFINGNKTEKTSQGDIVYSGAYQPTIAMNDGDDFFNGRIEEVKVYTRALSDFEIMLLQTGVSFENYWNKDFSSSTVYYQEGNVGIGTTETGSHKLAVEGSIGARGIKVEATGWSDFVFEDDYALRSLEETEQFISENNHLPEIPSEAEVMAEGINLGDMDAKLLQKIEELTLYLIEQHKEIKELKAKVHSLENR